MTPDKIRNPDFPLEITIEDIKAAQQEIVQDLVTSADRTDLLVKDSLTIEGSAEEVSDAPKKESPAALKIAQIKANIAALRLAKKEEREAPLPDGEHEIMKGTGDDAELKERLVIQNGMKNGICEFWNKGFIKCILRSQEVQTEPMGKQH